MEKINFENLPSTNTPLDADTLNGMQSNIEKSVVAVGETQPITSENVWIKKGKNLFNKNLGFINAYINVNAKIIADRYNALFNQHIPVKAGETYTVKANQNVFNMYMNFFEADGTFISYQGSATTTQQITVTAPQNAEYALSQFNYDGSTTVTSTIIDSLDLMIVQGQTAGTYESYVEKEILVKNDNGVFEEFFDESDIPNVDTSRWTQTLLGYRYTNGNNVVYAGTVVASFSSGSVNFDITNLGLAERPDTVQLTANSLRYPLRYDYDNSTATRLKIEVINNGSVYSHTGNVRFSMTVYGKLV